MKSFSSCEIERVKRAWKLLTSRQSYNKTCAGPGDRVALLSRRTILPYSETTVESITTYPGGNWLKLDANWRYLTFPELL